MTWRYYETPHHDTVTCQVKGNDVTIAFQSSINQLHGNARDSRPVLKGKLA